MDYYGLNELPETYKRYKTYTRDFETWLMKIAKRRGLEVAAQAESDAKIAAAKRSQGQTKPHRILTKHLLPVAQAVANSGVPLDDVSGLADLDDAIRARREVGEWYRFNKKVDDTHPFFISILTDVRKVFKSYLFTAQTHEEQNGGQIENDESQRNTNYAMFFSLTNNLADDLNHAVEEDLNSVEDSTVPEQQSQTFQKERSNTPTVTLTPEELDLDQEFQVLCFLYDLFQLRQRVKRVWGDWLDSNIGTMTAALISDLALGIIHKNVTSLVESLEDDAESRKIYDIIEKLHQSLPSAQRDDELPSEGGLQTIYPADLLCVDGIYYMERFWKLDEDSIDGILKDDSEDNCVFRFLMHFTLIKTSELRVATLDRFTESICSTKASSHIWLPFGLQVLLDIQEDIGDHLGNVYLDVYDHGLTMSELMRAHIVYEDEMWDKGDKPEYMTLQEVKFSNIYLPTLERLLDWLKQLEQKGSAELTNLRTGTFLALHPILSGLTMWYYHRMYHTSSISKTQWFIVGIAHLYNACRQIGGLEDEWEDLEFIIKSQGAARIYVGAAPTDPELFVTRLCLALCSSTRMFGKDYQGGSQRTTQDQKRKRGLESYCKIEADIQSYYDTRARSERWVRLHNIFARLKAEMDETAVNTSREQSGAVSSDLKDSAKVIFASVAAQRTSSLKGKKLKKKARNKPPDFSKLDSVHDRLLEYATDKMGEYAVYTEFDHLSFFRRAYAALSRIRSEILWDYSEAVATLDAKQEPPNDFTLLVNLFLHLSTPRDKKNKKAMEAHDKAIDNLRKISAILEALIDEGGYTDVDNAEEQYYQRLLHGRVSDRKPKSRKGSAQTAPNATQYAKEEVNVPGSYPLSDSDKSGGAAANISLDQKASNATQDAQEEVEMPGSYPLSCFDKSQGAVDNAPFVCGTSEGASSCSYDCPCSSIKVPSHFRANKQVFTDGIRLPVPGPAFCAQTEDAQTLVEAETDKLDNANGFIENAGRYMFSQDYDTLQSRYHAFRSRSAEVESSYPLLAPMEPLSQEVDVGDVVDYFVSEERSASEQLTELEALHAQIRGLGICKKGLSEVQAPTSSAEKSSWSEETLTLMSGPYDVDLSSCKEALMPPNFAITDHTGFPPDQESARVSTEPNRPTSQDKPKKKKHSGLGAKERRQEKRAAARAALEEIQGNDAKVAVEDEQNVKPVVDKAVGTPSLEHLSIVAVRKEPRYLHGVYHRLTYRSTRSIRRAGIVYRMLFLYRFGRPLVSARLVGAKKHRISHHCYGKCFVGRAVLGEAIKEITHVGKCVEGEA